MTCESTVANAHAEHGPVENDDEQQIEHDVRKAANDQDIQRHARVADRAQDAGADVVDHVGDDARIVDVHVQQRVLQNLLGHAHRDEYRARRNEADDHDDDAADDRQRHRGVHGLRDVLAVLRAEELRDDDRRARRNADEEADQQVDNRAGRANGRERLLADILADDDRIDRIVELLEEGPDQNREKEQQKLLPDHAVYN
jgi:hypothetical protein